MTGIDPALSLHIVTAGSILIFKLGVLIVGYLIARLGYQLLLQGIRGEFKFQGKYRETTLDLISASPGIFFIFLATVLLVVGVLKDKPFGTEQLREAASVSSETPNQRRNAARAAGQTRPPATRPIGGQSHGTPCDAFATRKASGSSRDGHRRARARRGCRPDPAHPGAR